MNDKNILLKELQKIGLTKNVASVYVVLHDMGEAKAGEIVRKTGLHRHIVYVSLETLQEKKLIAKAEVKGVALFKVLDPGRLMNEIREKESVVENLIEQLRAKHHVSIQEVIVHEGAEEMRKLRTVLYSRMTKDDTLHLIGISTEWFGIMGEKFLNSIKKIQRETGFHTKGIGSEVDENEVRYKKDVNGLIDYKVIPDITTKTSDIEIWPDRILISLFVEPYTSVEIVNPHIVKNYLDYFNLLWKQEVRTYSGWDDIKKLYWNELMPELRDGAVEYVIGAGYGMYGTQKEVAEIFRKYNQYIIKHKGKKFALFYEQHRDFFEKEIKELGDKQFECVKVKYLPDDHYSPMEIHILHDKAVISYFGEHPVSTVYENPDIVRGFKKNFDLLWSIAKD